RGFGELAAGHQGAVPFRELPTAGGTAQSFNALVRACPRPLHDVTFAGTIAPCTVWIRARESSISCFRWRRQCHSGPPLARNGLHGTEATPVVPRYYSPGLPKKRARSH